MNVKLKDIAYGQLNLLDSDKLDKTIHSDASLMMSGDADAFVAADKLAASGATSIIVTDDDGNVRGLIFPTWIQEQLLKTRRVNTADFEEALRYIKEEGDLNVSYPGELPTYHHEWLNLDRPALFWCDKGEHYIDTQTCPYHK